MDFSSTKITSILEIFIGKLRSCQDNNWNFEPLNDSQFGTVGTIGTSGTLSVIVYYSSLARSQSNKLLFQQLDFIKVTRQAVSPATFAWRYFEASHDEGFTSLQSAQVNHGSQLLLLSQCALYAGPGGQRMDHVAVKICGG
jgi:hypothetical protein